VRGGEHKGNFKVNWPLIKSDQIGSSKIAYLTVMMEIQGIKWSSIYPPLSDLSCVQKNFCFYKNNGYAGFRLSST